ncbi:phage tail protein [Oceanobacillus caeni]|uniref:phage tail protein n=1 Tax=Oceanobacillus caeni TaxID=405946 RepID=UPI000761E179|nr:phage tail protein [Oceanobacillus caeni]
MYNTGQTAVFLKDLKGREYPAITEVKRNKRVNGQRELTLSFLYTEINKDFMDQLEFGWQVLFKGEWYTITHPGYSTDGDYLAIDVTAILSFFVDLNGYYLQDSVEDKSFTPANYFRDLFKGTPYTYVLVDYLASNTLNYQDNQSKTERFLYGIDRFKGEYKVQGKVAYIYDQVGSDKDVILHEDLNVNSVSIDVDASGFHTWAKGYGDLPEGEEDGDYRLEVEYISPLAEKYGLIEGPAIKDGKYKKADELTKAVKEQVENSYKISTTIEAIDLTNNGYPEMIFEEGDRVWLYVSRLNLNQQVRVMEIEETFDWEGNIIDASYVVGNEGIASRYKTEQYNTIADFRDIQSGRKKLEYNWLPDAVRRASEIINGNDDSLFKYGAGEIIGINQSNPNGYMRFNTDGLGFSRDGGKTYQSAITYEGIVADAITTGTLRSILIEAVEIYGSRIEGTEIYGSKFISEKSKDEFMKIEGSYLVSQGIHDRTWMGESGNNQVRLMLQNGQIRARNDDKDWSLYFNDYGISTFSDGSGAVMDSDASGFIEFHSTRYHTSRGLTIGSGARIALESTSSIGGRIYLNPNGASVRVSNADDTISYPIYASAFNNSSSITYKTNIEKLEVEALPVVNNLKIMQYVLQSDVDQGVYYNWQVGVISELSPEISTTDGLAVNHNKWLGYLTKALQEEYKARTGLEQRVEDLELMMEVLVNGEGTETAAA